jgi:hypothetical protein
MYDYPLLHPKLEKQHSKSSIIQYGLTTRLTNPGCGQTQTAKGAEKMEHLRCECENYSEPLWTKLAEALTQLFNDISIDVVPRVDFGTNQCDLQHTASLAAVAYTWQSLKERTTHTTPD